MIRVTLNVHAFAMIVGTNGLFQLDGWFCYDAATPLYNFVGALGACLFTLVSHASYVSYKTVH